MKTMLKNHKRFLTALLAVAMAFSVFASTAWAIPEYDVTVNVQLWMYDEYVNDIDVTIDPATFDIHDTYGWPGTLPADNYYDPTVVYPANRPSALDATWIAFNDEWGIFDTTENSGWGWDRYPDGDDIIWRGVWVDGIFGYYKEEDPIWSSPSHWAGYAWTLTVNGAASDLYASNVELVDGATIIWNYTYTEADIDR